MDTTERRVRCVGCGALVPQSPGPTHRYIGASPGCWAIYGAVQVRGYEDARFALRQTGVDAYAAQHPGTPSPQAIQSVTVHLISLCLQLEHGYTPEQGRAAIQRAVQHKAAFVWLDPPPSLGAVTILDVQAARDPAEFADVLRRWAQAGRPGHPTTRACAAGRAGWMSRPLVGAGTAGLEKGAGRSTCVQAARLARLGAQPRRRLAGAEAAWYPAPEAWPSPGDPK